MRGKAWSFLFCAALACDGGGDTRNHGDVSVTHSDHFPVTGTLSWLPTDDCAR